MNILQINPYIRRAMRSVITFPMQINRRIIFDYELIYIEKGTLHFMYNEIIFECKAGDILLICPGIPHSFHIDKEDVFQPHIHFDLCYDLLSEKIPISFSDYPELSKHEKTLVRENCFSSLKNSPFLNISNKTEFLKNFYRIIDSNNHNLLRCRSCMLYLLDEIISQNCSKDFKRENSEVDIAQTIRSYLSANYQTPVTLFDLEKQFGYSKFYIEKLFKKEYGISVIEFHRGVRMNAAQKMLETNSVMSVCEALDFSSVYSFSRSFKSYFGKSPREYRKHEKTASDVE